MAQTERLNVFIERSRARNRGPGVSPRTARRTTVTPGNREDRGREQLDQVSPLDIDSFFPSVCVRVRKESVSTVSVLEELGQTSQGRAGPAEHQHAFLVTAVAQSRHLKDVRRG